MPRWCSRTSPMRRRCADVPLRSGGHAQRPARQAVAGHHAGRGRGHCSRRWRDAASKRRAPDRGAGHRPRHLAASSRRVSRPIARRLSSTGSSLTKTVQGDYSYPERPRGGGRVRRRGFLDAVFCTSDAMAMGILDVCRAHFPATGRCASGFMASTTCRCSISTRYPIAVHRLRQVSVTCMRWCAMIADPEAFVPGPAAGRWCRRASSCARGPPLPLPGRRGGPSPFPRGGREEGGGARCDHS